MESRVTDPEHDEGASSVVERPRPKILIVDDDPSNLGVFARAFRKNFWVRVADSALAALEELSREPVDILLTDYAMPVMNGIELLIAVAARWPTIHRVIVSGHFDLAELHDAQRSGLAAALIEKPWTKAEILELVDRLITKPTAPRTNE
jgi:CheY-like chemotaxis protein